MNNIERYINERNLEGGEALEARKLLQEGLSPLEVDMTLLNRMGLPAIKDYILTQGFQDLRQLEQAVRDYCQYPESSDPQLAEQQRQRFKKTKAMLGYIRRGLKEFHPK